MTIGQRIAQKRHRMDGLNPAQRRFRNFHRGSCDTLKRCVMNADKRTIGSPSDIQFDSVGIPLHGELKGLQRILRSVVGFPPVGQKDRHKRKPVNFCGTGQ